MSRRESFRAGLAVPLPVTAGLIPFGLVAGVTAIGASLSIVHMVTLSVIVFTGASQLAMIELLGQDAALAGASGRH